MFCAIWLLFFFHEKPRNNPLADPNSRASGTRQPTVIELDDESPEKFPYVIAFVCLLMVFVNAFAFAMVETIVVPMVREYFSWDDLETNLLFVGSGVLNFIALMSVTYLTRYFYERLLVLVSLVLNIVAFALFAAWGKELPLASFLIGWVLFNIGFPIGRVIMFSLYSKVLNKWQRQMGILMGLIVGAGSLARIGGKHHRQR